MVVVLFLPAKESVQHVGMSRTYQDKVQVVQTRANCALWSKGEKQRYSQQVKCSDAYKHPIIRSQSHSLHTQCQVKECVTGKMGSNRFNRVYET